jgi:O-antigen biosynthesis protein
MFEHDIVIIGVPIYNEEKYLYECLSSIASQVHSNFICIVSDNFSTDNSFEIADRFSREDSRFIVVKQLRNIGSSKNFEFLLNSSNSPFFMWIGGHDIVHKDLLKVFLHKMKSDQLACVFTNFMLIDEHGKEKRIDRSGDNWDTRDKNGFVRFVKGSMARGGCPPMNGLFRRKMLDNVCGVPRFSGPDRYILPVVGYYGNLERVEGCLYQHREITKPAESYLKRITGGENVSIAYNTKYPLVWALSRKYWALNDSVIGYFAFPFYILALMLRHLRPTLRIKKKLS